MIRLNLKKKKKKKNIVNIWMGCIPFSVIIQNHELFIRK